MEEDVTEQIGIIGHRSWIAQALMQGCDLQHVPYVVIPKDRAVSWDCTTLSCVYVFPGRRNPDEVDRAKELTLVRDVALNTRPGGSVVLLGSYADDMDGTTYGSHKSNVEREFSEFLGFQRTRPVRWTRGIVYRCPAVVGPGISRDSDMLIPSLARGETPRRPDAQATFITTADLVRDLLRIPKRTDLLQQSTNYIAPPPGREFMVSAAQMRDLFAAYDSLRGR